jgi:hypothetical protein
LSHPFDNAERDRSLPPLELNPLINPLLGQHMGRWAEVYFTSPPEKREQAVQDLLRELETEAATKQSQPDISPSQTSSSASQTSPYPPAQPTSSAGVSRAESPATPDLLCNACGQGNAANRIFCGHCGASLRAVPSEPKRSELFVPRSPAQGDLQKSAVETSPAQQELATDCADYWGRNNYLRHIDAPKLIPEYESAPYRYRVYIGTALALLIGFLAYTGWRQATGWSVTSHVLQKSAPAETQPAQQSSPPAPPQVQTPEPGGKAENQGAPGQEEAKDPPAATAQSRPPGTAGMSTRTTQESVPKAVLKDSAPEQSSESRALRENGSQELAIAQHYLHGAQGTARDSGEAAKWLWQSVRKENAAATLMLSDLYLKGDGVPKNCDQARLLLDAAARKGSAGAAERLRNLPAFGCE